MVGCGGFGGGVRKTLGRVPLLGSGFAVDPRQGRVKAENTFDSALKAAAFVVVAGVGSCTYRAGMCFVFQ